MTRAQDIKEGKTDRDFVTAWQRGMSNEEEESSSHDIQLSDQMDVDVIMKTANEEKQVYEMNLMNMRGLQKYSWQQQSLEAVQYYAYNLMILNEYLVNDSTGKNY